MFLKNLELHGFRNYTNTRVTFGPHLNVIHGRNGQGKSNLLEAIHLISTGRSFRTRKLADLPRKGEGEGAFALTAEVVKDGVTEIISVRCQGDKREVRTSQGNSPYLASLLGTLPIIFLSANDPSFVSGAPGDRRRFIDLHLAQTDSVYLNHLSRYHKAMKHKNVLLRTRAVEMLAPWEKIMAESGHFVIHKRCALLTELEKRALPWVQTLSAHTEDVRLSYRCSFPSYKEKEMLLGHWQAQRSRELEKESTLFGPHRDDIIIEICGKLAQAFASEGQKRTCGVALRFAEWHTMKERLGNPPLLAIDDFGAQLDSTRRHQLHVQLQSFGQVFLTLPDPDPELLEIPGARCLHVESGAVT